MIRNKINRQFKVPVDRQSKRLTEKTLLQKRMTKIDIACRNKVHKTAAFPNMFFFNQALKKTRPRELNQEKIEQS